MVEVTGDNECSVLSGPCKTLTEHLPEMCAQKMGAEVFVHWFPSIIGQTSTPKVVGKDPPQAASMAEEPVLEARCEQHEGAGSLWRVRVGVVKSEESLVCGRWGSRCVSFSPAIQSSPGSGHVCLMLRNLLTHLLHNSVLQGLSKRAARSRKAEKCCIKQMCIGFFAAGLVRALILVHEPRTY